MSHFYATIQGSRGEVSRTGTKRSGMTSYTASWQGCVRVELWEADGVDMAHVSLRQWHGQGAFPSIVLYDGPVSGKHENHTIGLHFEISGPMTDKDLRETAEGIMTFLVNRGVVANDLPEENLLESFWTSTSRGES